MGLYIIGSPWLTSCHGALTFLLSGGPGERPPCFAGIFQPKKHGWEGLQYWGHGSSSRIYGTNTGGLIPPSVSSFRSRSTLHTSIRGKPPGRVAALHISLKRSHPREILQISIFSFSLTRQVRLYVISSCHARQGRGCPTAGCNPQTLVCLLPHHTVGTTEEIRFCGAWKARFFCLRA